MIRTLDFNSFAAGTVIDDEYEGVSISATGGSGQAMIFDSANPTGGDNDLASDTLGGLLIISEDGDSSDPDDNASGGSIFFDFDNGVRMKEITFKDIEETSGPGTQVIFYDADGNVLARQFVEPTGDNGEVTVQLDVSGTARFEVQFVGSGAIDNVVFDDPGFGGANGDGIVSNGDAAALIDVDYEGDPEGDMIDNGDALLAGEAADDDIVDAQGGDDTVLAGAGDDDVYAGAGDDVVEGGAGDDLIYGDSALGNVGGSGSVRESFEWDLAVSGDGGDLSGGFSQDTGSVTVTFTEDFANTGVTTEYADDRGLVDGIPTDGAPADARSSLESVTNGENNCAIYDLDFSEPVNNVDFRINDIDGDGIVRVFAYDADGNQIEVNLSGGANLTLFDTDGIAGADLADSNGGYQPDDSPDYSLLVNIPGPVSRIEIQHWQDGGNNSGVNITDVYFDAPMGDIIGGNDNLDGQDGDDVIFGEGGDDTLTGGTGADQLSGGDGADLIVGGNAGDVADGGAGGTDSDTLDLSDSGPLRIVGQTTDADGNSTSGTVEFLNDDGSVSGTMTFTEIETLILPEVVNSGPQANDDAVTVDEDGSAEINVLANDTDADGDDLTITEASSPDGTVTITGGVLTFTPNENFNGPTTITYTIDDGNGGTDTATVSVSVTPINDAPDAVDDADSTDEDTPITVDLLANDTDVDGDAISLVSATVPADQGTLVDNGDGTVTFTPAPDFNGTATISYTIEDAQGLQDSATHTITVNAVGDAPIVVDDTAEVEEDTPVIIDLLGNDSDADGDPLTLVSATVPPEQGTLVDNGDGTVTFTPAPDFNGEATITYTVTDPDGNEGQGQAVVSVTAVNDAPDAVDDADSTDEDTPITVDLLANDTDVDGDTLSVVAVSVPAEQGTVVNNGDGTATFTPAPDFVGEATITYTISDGNGGEDTAAHIVDVTPLNDAPVAVDDVVETEEDTPVIIDLIGNDTDADGDPLTLVEATVPAEQGTLVDNGDGTVTFTPAPDFNGEATITYTVTDPSGTQDTGEAVVTVTPVNDAPVAVDDVASTPFNAPVVIDLLGNDTDPDGDTLTLVEATVPAEQGTLVDNGDGTVTFTPNPDFEGPATITYTVSDPDGLTDEGEVVVTIRDGIVEGTDGDDLIDTSYTGDPDGDVIDGDDAILPGTAGDDDSVVAGDGNDTVEAGQGSDTVDGGAGDDVINTGNGEIAPDLGYPFADSDELGFLPDADPEDDRDSVDGGAGNDTISTGDDRDTITGGDGDDVIDGGIDDDEITGDDGDDRIVGGEGNDVIEGGEGNDTIFAGNDPDLGLDAFDIPDDGSGPFGPDRNPDNGQDTVFGGAGDDVIFGADDDDVLDGGEGNDLIDGQIDDDILTGGSGDDTLIGGQGNDDLDGGDGNDSLEGGIGDDTLEGGAGDDLVDGGEGDDVLSGGDDRDTFVNVNAGDVVDGGDGGDDVDTLDLTGSVPEGGTYVIDFTSDDREDGIVNYFDADGNDAGQLVFEEIENIIPCFTPGTRIATPKGERKVEELQVGDRVITRDNGIQEIRWVGARDMTGAELERASHLKPVLIRQGALGNDLPERDMMVSPNHRVLVANDKTALYFEEREVLVAAKHLTGLDGVDIVDVSQTTYIHIMFDQHEVILSDGAWTESFQPGDQTLAGIGNAQREEILELFPELATEEGVDGYASARRSLKKHEAKLITD